MANVTRRIGLSLGADVCWPIAYEEIMRRLDLTIPIDGDNVRFEINRVTIEPFDLRQPCPYDLVIDRVTHWYHTSREWIKKSIVMDGLYVFNNPWAVQSMEKATTYAAMMRLGLPVPETWLIPPKEYEPSDDLEPTLERYAQLFDIGDIGDRLGYPLFMKPYDGGAWVGVTRIDSSDALKAAYEASGKRVMHLQQSVTPFDLFVRCVGLGPQVRMVRYDPSAPHHERYLIDFDVLTEDEASLLRDMTLTINSFFGWDFNSCEALRRDGVFYPIDFANPVPDSQVTSLHFHFPWLIKANIRWSVFCAATRRSKRPNLDWSPYEKVRERETDYRRRLAGYARVAHKRFETERFVEFCQSHLAHLDEVTWEFFGTDTAKDAVHKKVEAMFPSDEVEEFTEHYWGLIQFWRKTEQDRMSQHGDAVEDV